jgi:tol-pal system protein YbgF
MKLYAIGIALVLATLLPTSMSAAAPKHTHDTSRRMYDRIMTEFKHREYDAALAGFHLFMELHSQSALAANAQYWIGECQYRMGRYKDALNSFYDVVMNYPLSPKVAASTLKIGQTYIKLGDHDNARIMFDRVVDQYPDSSEADLARRTVELATEKGYQDN